MIKMLIAVNKVIFLKYSLVIFPLLDIRQEKIGFVGKRPIRQESKVNEFYCFEQAVQWAY